MTIDYNAPIREAVGGTLGETDFSSATGTVNVIGPKGKVGFVRDISCDVTTSIVGTTSVPEIVIGISSGDATYGRYRLGSTASLGYGTGIHRASQETDVTGNPPRLGGAYTGHVKLDGGPLTAGTGWIGRIPKDTAVVISKVIAVGAAAGKGYIRVEIDWF